MKVIHISGPFAGDWKMVEIPDSEGRLEALQALVGGYIEALPLEGSRVVTVYVNEEGLLLGLPAYVNWVSPSSGAVYQGIAGPLVILGPDSPEGESTEVTQESLLVAQRELKPLFPEPAFRLFVLGPSGPKEL